MITKLGCGGAMQGVVHALLVVGKVRASPAASEACKVSKD
jgi:hypothetical protein